MRPGALRHVIMDLRHLEHTLATVVNGLHEDDHRTDKSLRAPPPRKGPSPEDPRQCESVGINSDRRGPWGMVACGGGNE